MHDLKWSEGMSVGVESIDNDHKTLLLLINEINDAINSDSTETIIAEVFERLEEYIKLHFSREELLLEQCNYNDLEDHRKQHQQFINKIPSLKSQLLNANSTKVAQEIHLFLLNWLMTHIIIDDMSYAQTVHDHGLATIPQSEISFFERILSWIGQKISLNKRVFISSLVPITGLVVLSISIFWYSFQQYSNMQQFLGLTDLIRKINTLSHSLQAERGISVGYISSSYGNFSSELKTYRSITDAAQDDYQQTLSELPPELIDEDMSFHLDDGNEWLIKLKAQRSQIDNRQSNISNMQEYYSGLIASLLSVYEAIALLEMDSDLDRNITAISAMVNLKEAEGLKRAFGAQVLAKGRLTDIESQQLSRLFAKPAGLLKVFEHAASNHQKDEWKLFTEREIYTNASQLEENLLSMTDEGGLPDIDSNNWFEVMSGKTNQLGLLIDQLVADLEVKTTAKVHYLQGILISIAIALLLMLLTTLLISWLINQSIIFPVRRLTHAMTRLSKGHRELRFTDKFANDDIGRMVNAYEHSRRNLLQADIYSTIKLHRQTVNLEQKIRERDEYHQLASIDALTGAINRRKFTELADQELVRVKRYKHGLSIMMLDIDHFKNINDSYGHSSGDCVLKEFYQTCLNNVRDTDIVARFGGEEFVILLPETKLQQARDLAERVCIAVKNLRVVVDETTIKLTVSIGVTTWKTRLKNIDAMIEIADKALYKAKNSGRNRVISL